MKLFAHKQEKFESFFSLSLELVQVCCSYNTIVLDCGILQAVWDYSQECIAERWL